MWAWGIAAPAAGRGRGEGARASRAGSVFPATPPTRHARFVLGPDSASREPPRAGADPVVRARNLGAVAGAARRAALGKMHSQIDSGYSTRARAGELELAVATATRRANRVIIVMRPEIALTPLAASVLRTLARS